MIKLNKDWTLFLDRDGVINRKLDDDYVKNIDEFEFLPQVREAIWAIKKKVKRIVIVTNQQGIGKGLMSEEDLKKVHDFMLDYLNENEILLDKVYFCPDLAAQNSINRKPKIGMALQAQRDFPEIDFAKSLMVGDSFSDMEFGKNAGMTTVFINSDEKRKCEFADYQYPSLHELKLDLNS